MGWPGRWKGDSGAVPLARPPGTIEIMCGIIGVLRRPDSRPDEDADALLELATRLEQGWSQVLAATGTALSDPLARTAAVAGELNRRLGAMPGVKALVADPGLRLDLGIRLENLWNAVDVFDRDLDAGHIPIPAVALEDINEAMVGVKDNVWALARDRIRTAEAVADLVGSEGVGGQVEGMWAVQIALSALDRLEVRGRDSAGIEIVVSDHGLDPQAPEIRTRLAERITDEGYRSGAVRLEGEVVVFVYKVAAEIGELGDNTASLRSQIAGDDLLAAAMAGVGSRTRVLGHTRWASVGIISEPNAHPLDSLECGLSAGPLVTAVLNGDVDNFADLKAHHGLAIATEITTDAKVIPTLVSRGLGRGQDATEAFRASVSGFEGSVAIGALAASNPDQMMLALRGSGQGLFVGMTPDAFIVASEPYGVVEEASCYLRLDGETPADPSNPVGSQGQIVVLDAAAAGSVAGISRIGYDGSVLPVEESELVVPEVTTRDIDRGDSPHFFLKEVSEAPSSFLKTLRGRIVESGEGLDVRLGDEVLPAAIREKLAAGGFRRVIVIGQGTAAVAGESLVAFLSPLVGSRLEVTASLATELSGFGLAEDMSDTLVVAVSQSGTTTDTNRTVDVVRARGGSVIAIVNRRGSDLTDRTDGVLYTSDGRDVEMSVASTKAFYAQIAAGALLSYGIAEAVLPGGVDPAERSEMLEALRRIPRAMNEVLRTRPHIAEVAARHAPRNRYWAVVGNGVDRTAARELRIKLSELCYKSISQDSTEDKKHIDLSCEPMVLVCASGLDGSNADDVAKEVAIFRAHKATPIVLASDEQKYSSAVEMLVLPDVHRRLNFILATMAGHLFGYEAALAIDALARPLREARVAVERAIESGHLTETAFEELTAELRAPARSFFDGLRTGSYNGSLEASTAVRLATVFRYALGNSALEAYQIDFGRVGTPARVVEDLNLVLGLAIDELTRPVDAIKHQAKTVTVGISRSDETLLRAPLVREVMKAGAPRDRLSYRALRTLVALDPAVVEVVGYTRYRIEGDVEGEAIISVVDRGGVSRDIPSRTDTSPTLKGTKHRAAFEREVTVARGRNDGRTVILVPEVKDTQTTGLTLLHARFHDRLEASTMRSVMEGYRGRYAALKDAVTETEPSFRDDLLATMDVIDLLTEPVYVAAGHWTAGTR